MAEVLSRQRNKVINKIQQGWDDTTHVESSDFLGIAIGKKAKARQLLKRADRAKSNQYKLETDRIRAKKGIPKDSVLSNVVKGIESVAGVLTGKGSAGDEYESIGSGYQPGPPDPEPKKNNTLLYIGIVGALIALMIFLKYRKK